MGPININFEIAKKAECIIKHKKSERYQAKELKKYIKKCIKAEICPICGSKISSKDKADNDKCWTEVTCDHNKIHFTHKTNIRRYDDNYGD